MKVLNVFKLNIFNILCSMYKCKQNLKPNMRSEMNSLFKNLYVEQILVSIAFHTVDPTSGTK